jgi:molecular chaperone GrpE
MSDPPSDFGLSSSAADLWLVSHLDRLRRDNEGRLRAALLSLAEIAEAVERFWESPTAAELPAGWREGLAVLRGKVLQALARNDVTPIVAVGEPFNPRYHHAVGVCDGMGPPGTVARQVRPGYTWKGQVLQPAEVVTVAGTPGPDHAAPADPSGSGSP